MHIWPVFLGVFFILAGLNIILKTFFNFDIPFFKIAIGLFIIFIGIRVMFPSKWHGDFKPKADGRATIFSQQEMGGALVPHEHSIVFGSAKIDLTKLEVNGSVKIKVDTVFGSTEIKIDPSKPMKIHGSTAFGGIILPNGNSTAFGSVNYETDSYKEGQPFILLEVNTVFGGTEINKEPLK
jgi:predicted membrane protein